MQIPPRGIQHTPIPAAGQLIPADLLRKDCVRAMTPIHLTLAHRIQNGRLAQLVRAPALQAGCRGFESLTAHHPLVSGRPRKSRKANEASANTEVFVFLLPMRYSGSQ